MTPQASIKNLALPLATLGLVAWQAFPTLVAAWENDLYSRGAALAFLIWLAGQVVASVRLRGPSTQPALAWIALSMYLCAAGSMSGLRVFHHLALAAAISGVLDPGLLGLVTMAAASVWLPATGWFLSHWKSGGLDGWERPVAALILTLPMLAIATKSARPKPLHP